MSIVLPALIAIPIFSGIAGLIGLELFGIYTLSFAIIGYVSILDLGLTRAVMREVAQNLDNSESVHQIVNTAFVIVSMLGMVACVFMLLLNDFLIDFLKISSQYYDDVKAGFVWLGLCLPLLLIGQIWLAYFEGMARFKQVGLFKLFANCSVVIVPYLMLCILPTFTMLMAGLFMARLIILILTYYWLDKGFSVQWRYNIEDARRLFGFGSWLTVSAIISPIVVYFDRFMLSSVFGAKNIAFYTVPSELVMRLLSLPSAVGRVLFARLSHAPRGNENTIYWLGMMSLFLMAVMISLPLFVFAEFFLVAWMGESFQGEPSVIFRILLIGFIMNAIAQIPFASLQAQGKSKLIAILHCAEIVPYLVVLYFLTMNYGMIGVALSWTLRIFLDTAFLLYFDKLKG